MTLPSLDIVVCVHNALEDTRACLEALQRVSYPRDKLAVILVDDGSDAPTAEFLREFADTTGMVRLHRRNEAGGYTIAANVGLHDTTADLIVMVNSDSIVSPDALTKIAQTFERAPDIGIVGPLSNAASWQSVPERSAPEGGWVINQIPENLTIADMDALVEVVSGTLPQTVRVPLVNGFCFAIRREVVEAIGDFDDVGFPAGFGEEDDYCLRAANAGFGLAIACDTYVFHAKSKSYGSSRREKLTAAGQEKLRFKHSAARLGRAVATMASNPYLRQMREDLSAELAQRQLN